MSSFFCHFILLVYLLTLKSNKFNFILSKNLTTTIHKNRQTQKEDSLENRQEVNLKFLKNENLEEREKTSKSKNKIIFKNKKDGQNGNSKHKRRI